MNFLGYALVLGVLLLVGLFWGIKRKGSQISVEEFWKEKEEEYGERRILSGFARYLGGHPRFERVTDGLLFLMSRSLWFENFEKGPNIFGFTMPFEKVIFRVPLQKISSLGSTSEKDFGNTDFGSRLFHYQRLSRKPLYLTVNYVDEWGRQQTLYFDSMVDVRTWQDEFEKAKASCPPEEEPEPMVGVCPKCGKKVSPDFKLCPYCGCKLS
ncbi:MAG: zinc ribbon domain-containing protein [Candidatus Caldatribacteriaceae bacterium]